MTTTATLPQSLTRHWIASGLLALLAFGVCWIGAIAFWRARGSDPDTAELMLLLFVLPGGLLAAALMARKFLAEGAITATAPALAIVTAPVKPAPPAPLPLAMLATAVRSPHGASIEELADAMTDKKARPKLDATLVDPDGFPVTTARCAAADDAPLQDDIAAWLSASKLPAFDGEHLRALVLATHVTLELAGKAAGALLQEGQPAPLLELAPVLPGDWSTAQHHAAGLWLQHTVTQAGWPQDRITLVPILAADSTDTIPVRLLAQLATRASDARVTAMVIAYVSYIGDASVEAWSADHSLFTSSVAQGKIPGEGAVGLLLTDAAHAGTAPLIEPVATARRPGSADTARGAVTPLLADLAKGALAAAQADEAALAMIVADTGMRASRMLELMSVASIAPQLDDEKDIVPFGHASGYCGAVAGLTALALAGHLAVVRNAPVLWLSNEDAFQRCVALVRPPPVT